MALQILSSTPTSNAVSVPIDTKIQLGFNNPVDPFTIPYGVSIYSIGANTMTGPLMSELDVSSYDVKDPFDNISMVEYSYTVSGNDVTLTPLEPLSGGLKYYVQVVPGDDVSRFLSTKTFIDPVYSKAVSSHNGEMNVTSSYTGAQEAVYLLSITGSGAFDLMKDNIYQDSLTYEEGVEFIIDKKISASINGEFTVGDTIELVCFPAEGVTSIYKISFTTANYTTATVQSTRIEDKIYKNLINNLKIVSIMPAPFSINNERCNPVIVRFNNTLDPLQDLTDQIKVYKANLETGVARKIVNYYQIQGSTLKIYLVSVEPSGEFIDEGIFTSLPAASNGTGLLNYNSVNTWVGA